MKLEIEPIPISSWGISLANRLPKSEWGRVRQKVYRDADYKCEICGNTNSTLNCHEVWKFDDRKRIQRLVGFECLCKLCHDVKHFGRSLGTYNGGYIKELIKHWCRVNKKKESDFYVYQRKIFEINKKRADKFYVVKIGRGFLV